MAIGSFMDNAVDTIVNAAKGGIKSNKAINPLNKGFGNFTGGVEGVGRLLNGEGFSEAARNTFAASKKEVNGKQVVDKWNNKKIAGSVLGAAAIGRVASGGGAYKDGNGNTNLIGVPFV